MTITTDYTARDNPDTMFGGALSAYRMLYWMKDILCNFMSDPINIKDNRICKMLNMQNGATPEQLNALFSVGVAYSDNTQKAGTTPVIFISLGAIQYPARSINRIGSDPVAACGAVPMYKGQRHKSINLVVTVITEKYDSTVVLTDLLADFLLINERELAEDNGMISDFQLQGVSEPVFKQIGSTQHPKPVYEQKIGITVVGGISWTRDTQGPVYRGMQQTVSIKD